MVEAKFLNIITKEVKWLPVKGVSDPSKKEWSDMSYPERWKWWKKVEESIKCPKGFWLVSFKVSWGIINSHQCFEEEWQHPRWGRIVGPTFVGNA